MKQSIAASHTDATGLTQEEGVSEALTAEQVRLLYAHLPISQAVALVNGVLLAFVQAMVVDVGPVTGWLACLVIVTAARSSLGAAFARRTRTRLSLARWRGYFLAGVAASATVWGAAALLLYPPASVAHQAFVAFTVGGMVAGSVTVLTPVYGAFVLFAAGALVPVIARFALGGDEVHYAMAAMATIFLAAMLAIGKRIHATTQESLRLGLDNRHLVERLQREKAQVEHMNQALETRVQERTAALQELDRRKNEFLAMLSHELRNPLAPVRNSLYLLKRVDPSSENARHALEVIERQTLHIARLVDDLLDVTRIARGKIELRRETTDLIHLVIRTVDDHRSMFHAMNVELAQALPERPLYAIVDPTRIAQAIGNLLQNAVKFTPEGGRVTVSLRAVGDSAEVEIGDTGRGIAPALLPFLFQPFTQGERAAARIEGGIGLGLALVKGIAELHGGTVEVESRGAGQGATFIVRVPLLSTLQAAEQARPEAAHLRSHGRRVLVVDDNHDAADSLAQVVETFGHKADVAYDGDSAIAEARATTPDVVLCDLGLPGVSGYDVARALRNERSDIRLVAVSGHARPEDIAEATRAGFDSHLAKPPSPESVRRALL